MCHFRPKDVKLFELQRSLHRTNFDAIFSQCVLEEILNLNSCRNINEIRSFLQFKMSIERLTMELNDELIKLNETIRDDLVRAESLLSRIADDCERKVDVEKTYFEAADQQLEKIRMMREIEDHMLQAKKHLLLITKQILERQIVERLEKLDDL
ncbi:hypothetical protein QAD02_004067 [Eretmocerus hayati]|uniref:Uncharacterized protein n=1 Tax=Eretmocerus hayati TaxID=131215 RepID=A0ACC2NRF4_9HYME|nr:hypothetical protein QAD02_004067 [Eretmocerus hayati]